MSTLKAVVRHEREEGETNADPELARKGFRVRGGMLPRPAALTTAVLTRRLCTWDEFFFGLQMLFLLACPWTEGIERSSRQEDMEPLCHPHHMQREVLHSARINHLIHVCKLTHKDTLFIQKAL